MWLPEGQRSANIIVEAVRDQGCDAVPSEYWDSCCESWSSPLIHSTAFVITNTEAVLTTSRKHLEISTLGVGEHEITSQLFIGYLGMSIDARLNLKQQPITSDAEYRRPKAEQEEITLSGGHLKAVCVIAGMLPARRTASPLPSMKVISSPDELRTEERQHSLLRWQTQWHAADSGRRMDPMVRSTSTSHRCCQDKDASVRTFIVSNTITPQSARPVPELAGSKRNDLGMVLNRTLQPESIVEEMLGSKAAWDASSNFATEVLKELWFIERKRAKDMEEVT
ncbi:hypothetical protein J6590_060708 [Homalodisca vitripennis]|nr:hypothetical protein J6590_060708 [Homalodisca vitripennis]